MPASEPDTVWGYGIWIERFADGAQKFSAAGANAHRRNEVTP